MEGLTIAIATLDLMCAQQITCAIGQRDDLVPVTGHTLHLNQALVSQVAEIASPRVGSLPVAVTEVFDGYHAERPDGRQRSCFGAAQRVRPVSTIVDEFTDAPARQVEIAHERALDISIAIRGTLVIAAPRVRFEFVVRTWTAAKTRAGVLFVAVAFLAICQAVRLIVDGMVMTVVRNVWHPWLPRFVTIAPAPIIALARIAHVARIEIKHCDLRQSWRSAQREPRRSGRRLCDRTEFCALRYKELG